MLRVAASHLDAVGLLLQLAGVQQQGRIRSDAFRWEGNCIPHRQIVQHNTRPYNFANFSWLVKWSATYGTTKCSTTISLLKSQFNALPQSAHNSPDGIKYVYLKLREMETV